MPPELLNNIVIIIAGVVTLLVASLTGGAVSARLTKKDVAINYEQLYEKSSIKGDKLAERVDQQDEKLKEQTKQIARDAIAVAETQAKNALALAAFSAKLELVESQRIEQEKRHAHEIATLNATIAVLQADNTSVKTDLGAAMSKLAKTEQWVDLLKVRENPPALSAAETDAIQTLRDKPPASDKPPITPGSEAA